MKAKHKTANTVTAQTDRITLNALPVYFAALVSELLNTRVQSRYAAQMIYACHRRIPMMPIFITQLCKANPSGTVYKTRKKTPVSTARTIAHIKNVRFTT